MRLADVYQGPAGHAILWQLLNERTPDVNISHRAMPSWEQHVAYVTSKPHPHWYMVDAGEEDFVGSIYLTHQREIGVGILKRYQGMQYGPMAVRMLMDRVPGKFLANVNPLNMKSAEMFRKLGFKQLQVTYEKTT